MSKIYTGTDLIERIAAEIHSRGFCEVRPGVFLASQENIISDQKGWEGDALKSFDFKKADFWLTTDDAAAKPEGFNSIKEFLVDSLETKKRMSFPSDVVYYYVVDRLGLGG